MVVIIALLGCSDSSIARDAERVQELISTLPAVGELYELSRDITADDQWVLLGWHGGPTGFLRCEYFAGSMLPYPIAYVYQAQHYYPARQKYNVNRSGSNTTLTGLTTGAAPTDREAHETNLLSYAIIEKVRAHFAAQNKRVALIGHSFGTILTSGYLTIVGSNFDKIILAAGRTEMPQRVINSFRAGYFAHFALAADPNASGYCIRSQPVQEPLSVQERFPREMTRPFSSNPTTCGISYSGVNTWRSTWAGSKLSADAASNYYPSVLYALDLSIMLVGTGRNDDRVGVMGASEINSLRSAGATVCITNDEHDLMGFFDTSNVITRFIESEASGDGLCPPVANMVACS